MKYATRLGCFSLIACITACAPSGYYDDHGYYHPYTTGDHGDHPPLAGGPAYNPSAPGYTANPSYTSPAPVYDNSNYRVQSTAAVTAAPYARAGFYDANGYYIPLSSGPNVPPDAFPPQGMCRVWFPNRPINYEPSIESCTGIQSRLPSGAYVVFGG